MESYQFSYDLLQGVKVRYAKGDIEVRLEDVGKCSLSLVVMREW